ncbi:MAG: helix-turn-helix transcriptional regulator [Ruminococcaceae bacterium]|nr:helix-turn-helix transcriptional regulator [Oscillospiraceae bacterium]
MDERIFPYTPKEAKAAGIEHGLKAVNKALPFPSRLRELRNNHPQQPSQQFLAEKLGVAKPTVSLYEVGENVPDAKTIVKLAQFYGVSTDYILCQTDDPSVNTDTKTAVAVTGLSKAAVDVLRAFRKNDALLDGGERIAPRMLDILNALFITDSESLLLFIRSMWTGIELEVNKKSISEKDEWAQDIDFDQFLEDGHVLLSIEQGSRYAFLDAQTHMAKLVEEMYSSLIKLYKNGGGEDGEHPQD